MSSKQYRLVEAGEMAVSSRFMTRVDEQGVTWCGYHERECVVLRVSLGMAQIEWCADGKRTAKPVSEVWREEA